MLLFGMMPEMMDDGPGHAKHVLWMFCPFFFP